LKSARLPENPKIYAMFRRELVPPENRKPRRSGAFERQDQKF